ncbi:hypothetical protein DFQ11_10311 [Winogradskyella epiphytica]|uniref:Uncharacterized protein n=1 Tax=Winogradskyella epiphytica TaxID=262005 RepID=A0A2V4XS92_9FLAO|nr:hypothetical protein [Winogradskyella epiphytica]PYE80931.1 hypothetical protein DFQ11_10311 [Winogradskyella epiphytica]GGW65620.1 hypothetical protein GCM10008085_16750 [Winogradskyella epiphytica]
MNTRKGTIKKNTDYSKIRVTSNGAFYMRSEDIFNNKTESLSLLSKLSKALDRYKSNQTNSIAKTKLRVKQI